LDEVRRPFDILICNSSVFHFPAAQSKFRVQQMKSNMATSRCCVWIQINFQMQIMKSNMGKSFALAFAFIHKRKKKNCVSVSETRVNVVHSSFI
jgi:hypothetical protein